MNRAELIVEGKREHAWMRGSKGAHLGMARARDEMKWGIPAAYPHLTIFQTPQADSALSTAKEDENFVSCASNGSKPTFPYRWVMTVEATG